jgi:hypothetical protein
MRWDVRGCILHIGMPKTGTSSIQRSLNGFVDANFVWYQDHKGRTNHSPAVFGTIGAMTRHMRSSGISEPESIAQEKFDEMIRFAGERSLLVSGEGMTFLELEQLRDFAGYLRSRSLEKFTIVAYVRSPVGYVTSLARATKGGSLKNLPLRRSINYRAFFEKFDQVFGRDNVLLWKFDPSSFPSGCVVQDFCAKIGIDVRPDKIVRENESLSREAIALRYTYYRRGIAIGSTSLTPRERLRLSRRLKGIGSRKFRFSPNLLRPFLELNGQDIEWMEQRLGQSLEEPAWDEHRDDDVRDEWDLLRPDPQVIAQLREMLGADAPKGVTGDTPDEVALLVHALLGRGTRRVGLSDAPPKWRQKRARSPEVG